MHTRAWKNVISFKIFGLFRVGTKLTPILVILVILNILLILSSADFNFCTAGNCIWWLQLQPSFSIDFHNFGVEFDTYILYYIRNYFPGGKLLEKNSAYLSTVWKMIVAFSLSYIWILVMFGIYLFSDWSMFNIKK